LSRTLLIVGGGVQAVPGIRLAAGMGLHVVVADRDENAPGFAHAHDRLLASAYHPDETLAAARRYHRTVRPIDGVICLAVDAPVTVAVVARALGLPGLPLEAARRAVDKLAMKRKFSADDIPVPWFAPLERRADLDRVVAEEGFALVIKPVDSRGSRGVLKLDETVDLDWAYETALENSPSGRVMVERFMPGPQVSTESVVIDGRAYTLGFSDRNYELVARTAPYMIENGGELPSALPEETQGKVRALVEAAAASLGVTNGVVKGDIVVCDGRPHVIELAARLSGGYFCTHEIPLNTGVSIIAAVIRLALGETVSVQEVTARRNRPVVQRYIFPEPGRITAIERLDEARARPGVAEIIMSAGVGDVIAPPTFSGCTAGMVIATGETRDEAIENAVRAVDTIKVTTRPV
jgi:biotin carboxylase